MSKDASDAIDSVHTSTWYFEYGDCRVAQSLSAKETHSYRNAGMLEFRGYLFSDSYAVVNLGRGMM